MKSALKKLCAPFAAASVSFAATHALAQDVAPAAPATPTPATAPVTTEPTTSPTVAVSEPVAPPVVPSTELPDLDAFNPRDHFLKNEDGETFDSRGPMYLCADNTTSCWTQEQRNAWAVREFQLMARTTVYTCQQYYRDENLIDYYNAIVENNQSTLQQSFHTVAAYFEAKTETPRAALLAFDALEIASGNIYSGASSPEYCVPATQILRHAATLQDDGAVVRIAHRIMLRPAA